MAQFSVLRAKVKAKAPRAPMSADVELARAFMMPAFFVAMADGVMHPEETKAIARVITREPAVGRLALGDDDLFEVMEDLGRDVAHGDPEDLIESALERLTEADCRKAIGYALEVAHADGEFDVEEQGTLYALAKNFGVSAGEMTEMMKAQAVTNYNAAGQA